jgi:hypothetical protein
MIAAAARGRHDVGGGLRERHSCGFSARLPRPSNGDRRNRPDPQRDRKDRMSDMRPRRARPVLGYDLIFAAGIHTNKLIGAATDRWLTRVLRASFFMLRDWFVVEVLLSPH